MKVISVRYTFCSVMLGHFHLCTASGGHFLFAMVGADLRPGLSLFSKLRSNSWFL